MIALLLAACAPDWSDPVPVDHPLDDELRFDHVQAKGTHNSYHVPTEGNPHPELQYVHAPLEFQLGAQGIRHFELDVDLDSETGRFRVRHIPVIDENATCAWLVDCVAELARWSRFNLDHGPIVVLIEPKGSPDPEDAEATEAWLAALEQDVLDGWPQERLLSPALVQGDAATLADAVVDGWPVLGALRGRAMFVLHGPTSLHEVYVAGPDPALFAAGYGPPVADWAVVRVLNDPVGGADEIAEALAAGHLVRTRADGPAWFDLAEAEAALASGAQLVSTDHEVMVEGEGELPWPDGAPYRCNPVTAPASCTPEAIEDPASIDVDGAGPG